MKSFKVSKSEQRKQGLDETIFWCLLILAFLIPLLIHPFIYNAFELPKITLLRLMSILLLILWTARALLHSKADIKRTHLDIYVLIFLLLIALSTIFSPHPLAGLLGRYTRHEGLLTFLSYGLVFFTAVQVFSSERLRILSRAVVSSASLASIYGLSQYFGYDPFTWGGAPAIEIHRSLSTFGNSVLFGAFLALVFPVAVCLFLDSSKGKEEFFSGVGFFLIFFALVTTFSRGAWLAGLVSMLFLFFILRVEGVSKRKLIIVSLIIILVIIAVELVALTAAIPSQELGTRAVSALNPQQSSIRKRLLIWKVALEGIKERPLLGYGPDSFNLIFYKFQTVEHVRAFSSTTKPFTFADNAHNYLIQLSATMGIPTALLAVLFLFFFFVGASKGIYRKKELRILRSGFLAGIVSYVVALLFGISTVGSATLFWLFLGSLASERHWVLNISWKERSYILRIFLYLLIASIGVILAFFSFRMLWADVHFARARSFGNSGIFNQAAREFEVAVKLNPWEDIYRGELGLNYFKWAEKDSRNERLLEVAAFHLERAKRISPLMLDHYLILGNLYRFGGMWFGEKYYISAEKNLKEAIKISPNAPGAHYLLGFVYLLEGKEKIADYELSKAKSISPNYEPIYYNLGEYFEERGEIEQAKEMYRRAIKQDDKRAREALEKLEGRN